MATCCRGDGSDQQLPSSTFSLSSCPIASKYSEIKVIRLDKSITWYSESYLASLSEIEAKCSGTKFQNLSLNSYNLVDDCTKDISILLIRNQRRSGYMMFSGIKETG